MTFHFILIQDSTTFIDNTQLAVLEITGVPFTGELVLAIAQLARIAT